MACGTGKTLVGCFLAETIAARRVLVLVPSLSLLAQTLREWGLAADSRYLAVCSDQTVTGDDADAVVASTSELSFPVTTDPAVIARFLAPARQRPSGFVCHLSVVGTGRGGTRAWNSRVRSRDR
jgi:predicted helicase